MSDDRFDLARAADEMADLLREEEAAPPDFQTLLDAMTPERWRELDEFEARHKVLERAYDNGCTALERGLHEEAETLLTLCAREGVGEADLLLAQLLHAQERLEEALPWYRKAITQGEIRAEKPAREIAASLDERSRP